MGPQVSDLLPKTSWYAAQKRRHSLTLISLSKLSVSIDVDQLGLDLLEIIDWLSTYLRSQTRIAVKKRDPSVIFTPIYLEAGPAKAKAKYKRQGKKTCIRGADS